MSSYAQLLVRGREIFSLRYEVDPTFLLSFTRDNLRVLEGDVARNHQRFDPDDGDQEIAILRASACELADPP